MSRTPLRRSLFSRKSGSSSALGCKVQARMSTSPGSVDLGDNLEFTHREGEIFFFKNSKKKSGEKDLVGIDLSDLRSKLDRMREIHHKNIFDLSVEERQIYEILVTHISLLISSPEPYKCYYDHVIKAFENIPRENIRPGTVGAFFVGCSLEHDSSGSLKHDSSGSLKHDSSGSLKHNKTCDAFCAGSMPSPDTFDRKGRKTEEFIPCFFPVLVANYHANGTVDFIEIHKAEDNSRTIIWIDNNENFTGFTESEKSYLDRYGAKEIKLMKYSKGNKSWSEVSPNFVPLSQVSTRIVSSGNPDGSIISSNPTNSNSVIAAGSTGSTNSSKNNYYVMWGFIAFIIIIVIIGAIYVYNREKKKQILVEGTSIASPSLPVLLPSRV